MSGNAPAWIKILRAYRMFVSDCRVWYRERTDPCRNGRVWLLVALNQFPGSEWLGDHMDRVTALANRIERRARDKRGIPPEVINAVEGTWHANA
jgi:hypothetical protein